MPSQTIMGLVPPAVRMVAVFAPDERCVVLETVHAIALVQDDQGQRLLPIVLDEDGAMCAANECGHFALYELPKDWYELRFPQTFWAGHGLPHDLRSVRQQLRQATRRRHSGRVIDLASRGLKAKAPPVIGRLNVETMPHAMLLDLFVTVAEEMQRRWPGRYELSEPQTQASRRRKSRKYR
jgi:hypothetical protein